MSVYALTCAEVSYADLHRHLIRVLGDLHYNFTFDLALRQRHWRCVVAFVAMANVPKC
jgi:hypothetical protein